MAQPQHPDWAALHPVLAGSFVPAGRSSAEPVWRGEKELSAGTVIYRGCRAVDTRAAIQLLEQPRFWTGEKGYAQEYARTCPSSALKALPGYLVMAKVVSPALLADMAMYPVTEAVFMTPERFGVRAGFPQELQRLHCTDIASTFAGKRFHGVIDGTEILLMPSAEHLEIVSIEMLYPSQQAVT